LSNSPPDAAAQGPAEPIEILVVDDDERNLVAFDAIFEGQGVDLVKARSGEEALRHLLKRDFPVILLDVHMPGMDGFETAALIHSAERTRHIPVIFLTANADISRAALGYARGAVDYLTKPIVPEVLRAKVAVFVELHKKNQLLASLQAAAHERRLNEERQRWETEAMRARLEQERQSAEALGVANRRLESALEETRRALAVRDDFLRIASHELKTPLTSVRLTVENMLRRKNQAAAYEPANVVRVLEVVNGQLERLSRLVEELMSAVVIQSGRLRVIPAEMDLSETARAVVDDLQTWVRTAGCDVVTHAPTPVKGRWDRFWIQQAVGNLLINATKFGAGKPIDVTVRNDDARAIIAIRDHGIGIAAADQERIFGPFERAVPIENYGGLGLGLHIVNRIVQEHGGRLHLESAPGQGATFTIELPVARPSA
jgi:signal transduction histidine kinase